MEFKVPEFIYRKDGQGQYLWDPFLWILAGGVVVVIFAAILAMDYFTPPAQGHDRAAEIAGQR